MNKKVRCIDCHFFAGLVLGDGDPDFVTVFRRDRAKIKNALKENRSINLSKIGGDYGYYRLRCHFEIWKVDSGNHFDKKAIENISKKRLARNCLYYLFDIDDLTLQGAETLQKREEDRRAFKTTMFYSRVALLVAILAIIVSVILPLFKTASPVNLF